MKSDAILIRKLSRYVTRYQTHEISIAKNQLWPIRCFSSINDDGNDDVKAKPEEKDPLLKSVPVKTVLDKVSFEKNVDKVQRPEKSVDRNYITARRAMTEFMLKSTDLEGLKTIKRRSPFDDEPPINVYWRKDVVAKASEVWGSQEGLVTQLIKREIERKKKQQTMFTITVDRL
jgi:zinc transporter 9